MQFAACEIVDVMGNDFTLFRQRQVFGEDRFF